MINTINNTTTHSMLYSYELIETNNSTLLTYGIVSIIYCLITALIFINITSMHYNKSSSSSSGLYTISTSSIVSSGNSVA